MTYMYIWEFIVRPEKRKQFERVYGPRGAWVQLFKNGRGYKYTDLHHDRAHPHRYITIDCWTSRREYLAFRKRFAADYEVLDEECSILTLRERPLGEYTPVSR